METLTGYKVPEELYDPKLNRAYKRTGGFNNDWSLTYAFTMRTLAELPEEALKRLRGVAGESLRYKTLSERFEYLKENPVETEVPVEALYEGLTSFAEELDSTGWETVDRLLLGRVGPEVKAAFGFPGGVGDLSQQALPGLLRMVTPGLVPRRVRPAPPARLVSGLGCKRTHLFAEPVHFAEHLVDGIRLFQNVLF